MKTFLISATIFFLVIILIVVFQNISSTMNGVYILLMYFDQQTSATLGILIITALGFIEGVLATFLAMSLVKDSKNEEEPGGANW